jgi:ATP-dependent Clp protease adaptor protein ClpS
MSEKIFEQSEVIDEIKEPNMYKVILLNDDYTTMDFVVQILVSIFHKSVSEATKIMLDVHEKGRGIVGIYTYDIAKSKISKTHALAKANNFPLKATMEKA